MRHDLDCDCDTFWKLFWELDFNEQLFKALEYPAWKLVDTKETDKEIIRTVKATPKMEAPGPVAKLLGSSFGYDEEGRFDKATKTHKFIITPNVLAGKLRNEGTVKCEPRGEGKSTRIVEIIAEAKVFGLGGMIESSFEKSFRTGWQKSADFINKWVKDHP